MAFLIQPFLDSALGDDNDGNGDDNDDDDNDADGDNDEHNNDEDQRQTKLSWSWLPAPPLAADGATSIFGATFSLPEPPHGAAPTRPPTRPRFIQCGIVLSKPWLAPLRHRLASPPRYEMIRDDGFL